MKGLILLELFSEARSLQSIIGGVDCARMICGQHPVEVQQFNKEKKMCCKISFVLFLLYNRYLCFLMCFLIKVILITKGVGIP